MAHVCVGRYFQSAVGYRGSSTSLVYVYGSSGGSFVDPSYTYDTGTSTTVDTGTYGTIRADFSSGTREVKGTLNGFPSVTFTGTLYINYQVTVSDDYAQGDGYAYIAYKVGSTETMIYEINGDFSGVTTHTETIAIPLSGVNLSNLSIIGIASGGYLSGSYNYTSGVRIWDAVCVPS